MYSQYFELAGNGGLFDYPVFFQYRLFALHIAPIGDIHRPGPLSDVAGPVVAVVADVASVGFYDTVFIDGGGNGGDEDGTGFFFRGCGLMALLVLVCVLKSPKQLSIGLFANGVTAQGATSKIPSLAYE